MNVSRERRDKRPRAFNDRSERIEFYSQNQARSSTRLQTVSDFVVVARSETRVSSSQRLPADSFLLSRDHRADKETEGCGERSESEFDEREKKKEKEREGESY